MEETKEQKIGRLQMEADDLKNATSEQGINTRLRLEKEIKDLRGGKK